MPTTSMLPHTNPMTMQEQNTGTSNNRHLSPASQTFTQQLQKETVFWQKNVHMCAFLLILSILS